MTRESLSARVLAFQQASLEGAAHEPFEALAVDLHRFQHAHSPVIQALCPQPAETLAQIPFVPVDLYKSLPVGTVAKDEPAVVFRTSGTTQGTRGEHRMRDTALYDSGALAWALKFLGSLPTTTANLLLDPAEAPDSSLSHMVALFADEHSWHLGLDGLDRDGLNRALRQASGAVFIGATAFALADWLDGEVAPPPPGSILMVTGGFKGRVHKLDGATLLDVTQAKLPGVRLVTEYGMTELSSQLWGTPGSAYAPPPWLRVIAVDPHTTLPVPTGEPGQLRFCDLANLDASIGVETQDQGIVHPDGTVTLHGRLSDAPARGCSLTVEEAWARRS